VRALPREDQKLIDLNLISTNKCCNCIFFQLKVYIYVPSTRIFTASGLQDVPDGRRKEESHPQVCNMCLTREEKKIDNLRSAKCA